MKFRNYPRFVIYLMMIAATALQAQGTGEISSPREFDSKFVMSHINDVYKDVPAMLSYCNYRNWSYIGTGYNHAGGDFRDLQSYNRLSEITIQTESVLGFEESGWTFYGMFSYLNGGADSVHNNTSYNRPRDGSPYYHFLKMPGQWKNQKYHFSAIAAKKINEKISTGLSVMYTGDLAFRQNDTRNNQTSLDAEVTLSGTYRIFGGHTLGLGAKYMKAKAQPNFSNKFQHESGDLTYNRYINAGLGTYVKNVIFPSIMHYEALGALVQWRHTRKRSDYSLVAEYHIGSDYVINKDIRSADEQNRILDYDFDKIKVKMAALNRVGNSMIYTSLNMMRITGEGNSLNEVSGSYVANYETEITDISLSSSLMNISSFSGDLTLHAGGHKENRFDKNFGYSFNWFNLYAGAEAAVPATIGSVNLKMSAGAVYNMNLDYKHDPKAASANIYTSWIGDPSMMWLTTDYLKIPLSLVCKVPAGDNLVQLQADAGALLPIKVNHQGGGGFTTDDKFLYINTSVKLFF